MNKGKIIALALCLLFIFAGVSAFAAPGPGFEIYLAQELLPNDRYLTVSDGVISDGNEQNYNIFSDSRNGRIVFRDFVFSDDEIASTVSVATDVDLTIEFRGKCSINTASGLESLNIGILNGRSGHVGVNVDVDGFLSIVNYGYAMDTAGIYASSPNIDLTLTGGQYSIKVLRGSELKKRAIKAEGKLAIENADIEIKMYGADENSPDASQHGIYGSSDISITDSRILVDIEGSVPGAAVQINGGSLAVSGSGLDLSAVYGLSSDGADIELLNSDVSISSLKNGIDASGGKFRTVSGNLVIESEGNGISSDKGMELRGNTKIKSNGFAAYSLGGKIKLSGGTAMPDGIEIKTFKYGNSERITTFATSDSKIAGDLTITGVVTGLDLLSSGKLFSVDLPSVLKVIAAVLAAVLGIAIILWLILRRDKKKPKYKYKYCYYRYTPR